MTDHETKRDVDDRELDVKVARKVLGYRWVQWSERTAGAKAMEFESGRFLASPGHVAAAHHVPASETVPRAPGWDRFVPALSRRIEPAVDAAEEIGLFRRQVTLRHEEGGGWTLGTERADGATVAVEGETLPKALCLAVLEAASTGESAAG